MHTEGAASPLCAALIPILALGASASAQIQTLVDFNDILVADPPWSAPLLGACTIDGTTLYAIIRGTITKNPYEWGSEIVKVEHIDGTPVNTVLVSNAQWKAFIGGGQWDTIGAPNKIGVLGDYLQYVDWFAYAVYRVHKTTGALSLFVSNDAVHQFVGLPPETQARLRAETSFSCERTMAMYESNSDNLLLVDDTKHLTTIHADLPEGH